MEQRQLDNVTDDGPNPCGSIAAIYERSKARRSTRTDLIPFADPKDVAVIVSGTGAGGVIVFQTPSGSTAHVEDVEVTRPYMHKVIHGAALTKAGR